MINITTSSRELSSTYKTIDITNTARRLFEIPLRELLKRVIKWNPLEVHAWAFGFSLGDASIDRAYLQTKRIDVETSRLGTLICFLTIFLLLATPPIKIRFYVRKDSRAKYKMRAYAKVSRELLELLASREFDKFNVFEEDYMFRSFLAGIIDSDGSIQPYVKKRGKKKQRLYFEPEVCIINSNTKLLEEIQKQLFSKYSIRGNVVYAYTPGVYRLRINSLESVYNFLKLTDNHLLNIERLPKAKVIQLYYKNKITIEELIKINKRLKDQNYKIHKILQSFILTMNKNKLVLVVDENGKIDINQATV